MYWVYFCVIWMEFKYKNAPSKRGEKGFTQHRNGRNTGCCLEETTTHPLVSNYTALFLMLVIASICQVLFLISGLGGLLISNFE